MAFKDTYRLEKVYYENMWTLLRSLKALKENPSADEITKVNEMLDNAIACNESIIIIYKNLGELYAEVAEKFADLLADLKALRDDLEMWKNEINEKIDEVNNYLMGHIRDLDDRVTSLEGRVSDLEDRMTTAENDIDALEGRMDTAEGDIDALEGRMDTAEGDIDALEGRMDTAEGDIDALEGRMDTAEDDIDGLQDDVSDLEQNKQDKLTAGFGIEIDANNEISVDTNDVQEKLIAGQNITLTPDATDPTKTVIEAQGGANYSAGFGIDIDANNEISVDTSDVQEKLTAGNGINIDSNNEISVDTNDVQEKLTAGFGIDIDSNNNISASDFGFTAGNALVSGQVGTVSIRTTSQNSLFGFKGDCKIWENASGTDLLNYLQDVKALRVTPTFGTNSNNEPPLPQNVGDVFNIKVEITNMNIHDLTDNIYHVIPLAFSYGDNIQGIMNINGSTITKINYNFSLLAFGIEEIKKRIIPNHTYEINVNITTHNTYNGLEMMTNYMRGYTPSENNFTFKVNLYPFK